MHSCGNNWHADIVSREEQTVRQNNYSIKRETESDEDTAVAVDSFHLVNSRLDFLMPSV
jgi:hypothetical protein